MPSVCHGPPGHHAVARRVRPQRLARQVPQQRQGLRPPAARRQGAQGGARQWQRGPGAVQQGQGDVPARPAARRRDGRASALLAHPSQHPTPLGARRRALHDLLAPTSTPQMPQVLPERLPHGTAQPLPGLHLANDHMASTSLNARPKPLLSLLPRLSLGPKSRQTA